MALSLLQLANKLDKQAANIEKNASALAVSVVDVALKDLTFVATPVDTSRALSNWQVGIGQAPGEEIEPYVEGVLGSTRGESAAMAYEMGQRQLGDKRPGESIHLTNVVPYIQDLNEGSSSQAPAGFIERSVLQARVVVRNFRFWK